MVLQFPPLQSSAPAYLRYFAVLGLTAFVSYRLITLLAADVISTQETLPDVPREFSRVEMIIRARDLAYVLAPAPPAVLPLHVDEPKAVASNLAVEIDLAESSDAPSDDHANQTTWQTAAISGPSRPPLAKIDINRKPRAAANAIKLDNVKIAALVEPVLKKSRSPVPEPHVPAVASFSAAVQAEAPASPKVDAESIRKKLARRAPNAGELVLMHLRNEI